MVPLNVVNSSCAIHALRSIQLHRVQYSRLTLGSALQTTGNARGAVMIVGARRVTPAMLSPSTRARLKSTIGRKRMTLQRHNYGISLQDAYACHRMEYSH